MQTYTPAGGNTPQAQAVGNLSDSMGSVGKIIDTIKGSPAQTSANYNIPQASNQYVDMQKLYQMYVADAQRAQHYSGQLQGGAPQATPGGVTSGVTGQDVWNPTSGPQAITTPAPSIVSSIIGKQDQTSGNLLGSLADYITQAYKARQVSSDTAMQSLLSLGKDAIDKSTMTPYEKANLKLAERAQALSEFKEGYSADSLVAGGQTPNDFADKFMGGYIKWADIPNQYKQVVTKLVKDRGSNVDEINTAWQGMDNSVRLLDKVANLWGSMTESERRLPSIVADRIPSVAKTRAAINSLFYSSIEGELRKAAIGGRITQQEVNWIRNAVLPGPLDSYDSAKAKLDAVKYGLTIKRQDPNYQIGDNTLQEAQGSNSAMGSMGAGGGAGEWR